MGERFCDSNEKFPQLIQLIQSNNKCRLLIFDVQLLILFGIKSTSTRSNNGVRSLPAITRVLCAKQISQGNPGLPRGGGEAQRAILCQNYGKNCGVRMRTKCGDF